nr:Syn-Fes-1 protein [synthetic construct]
MYGKLNKLMKELEEFIQQVDKNWHGNGGNLHDLHQEVKHMIKNLHNFMQGDHENGKLQEVLQQLNHLLQEMHNHLQKRSNTVHHLKNDINQLLDDFHNLVHR